MTAKFILWRLGAELFTRAFSSACAKSVELFTRAFAVFCSPPLTGNWSLMTGHCVHLGFGVEKLGRVGGVCFWLIDITLGGTIPNCTRIFFANGENSNCIGKA